MIRGIKIIVCIFSLIVLTGCHSAPFKIRSADRSNTRELGMATGSASGLLFLGCIPMGVNGRFERAYARALFQHDADTLADVIISDKWAWTPVGNVYRITINGMALKKVPEQKSK